MSTAEGWAGSICRGTSRHQGGCSTADIQLKKEKVGRGVHSESEWSTSEGGAGSMM